MLAIDSFMAGMAMTISAAATHGGSCVIQNVMPDTFAFLSRTADMPAALRAQEFVSEIALEHQNFYVAEDFGGTQKILATATKFFDAQKYASVNSANTEKQLRETTKALLHALSTVTAQYKIVFPDFSCRATTSIGLSLLRFDAYGFTD